MRRYRTRISGPLLDRIDIHLSVPAVGWRDLADPAPAESSVAIRERVVAARVWQMERLERLGDGTTNAQLTARQVRRFCEVSGEGRTLLEQATERLALSARAYTRILKLARTIADLAGSERIEPAHVAEAV